MYAHSLQEYGLYPEWVSMCLLRLLIREAEYVHSPQEYGFSPRWVSMCVLRLPLREAETLDGIS